MKKTFLSVLILLVLGAVTAWITLRRFEYDQLYHPEPAVERVVIEAR